MIENTQGQDGLAHMAYFDRRRQVSMIYDGSVGPWIDIAVGGYGEPVIARAPFNNEPSLAAFEKTCQDFIRYMFAYDLGEDA